MCDESTAPYPPGLYNTDCDGCADCGRDGELGTLDPTGLPALGLVPLSMSTALDVGKQIGSLVFGGNSRSGGADPCCMPGFDPSGTYPRNSGVGGAPPDYRTPRAPFTEASPSGEGRKKDDYCDCIPIQYNGRWWMLGEVRNGRVYTGTPQDNNNGVWVEVDRNRQPISVPGYGAVGADDWEQAAAAPDPAGWVPQPPGVFGPTGAPPAAGPAPAPLMAGMSPLAVLLIGGAAVGLAIAAGGGR